MSLKFKKIVEKNFKNSLFSSATSPFWYGIANRMQLVINCHIEIHTIVIEVAHSHTHIYN